MGFASKRLALLGLAYLLPKAYAHIALWDPAMYGWDPNDPNQSQPVTPLYNMPFSEWWFHGYINSPPAAGAMMQLPSGGTYHGQVACNKALTTYGQNPAQQTGLYACDGDGPQGGIGAMHTADQWQSPNPTDVKGCGIAIAYKSDVTQIVPSDFTVITVNYTCPWFKHVDFQIPSDLPPCPPGGCHCMWGWVHNIDAGSEQMYFNGFRCEVTGATGTVALPQAQIARKCPVDKTNCTIGSKQPHYWLQAEQNNNHQGYYDPPFYNGDYGYQNGAQTDLFLALGSSTSAQAPATTTSTTPTTQAVPTTQTTQAAPTTQTTQNHVVTAPTTTLSTPTTTTTAATSIPTNASGAVCKRVKRALDQLDDPDKLARHRKRAEKRHVRNMVRRKRAERGEQAEWTTPLNSSFADLNKRTGDVDARDPSKVRRVSNSLGKRSCSKK